MNNIKVSRIFLSKTNTAGRTKGKAFDELVESIREKGVLVPVLVRPVDDRFEVVAGERRVMAARTAGLDEIPAVSRDMTDAEAREAQIVENLQRQDVHPLDEGELYRSLIESLKGKLTVDDIAAKVGKAVSHIRKRLALTNLIAAGQKAYRDGRLSHANAALVARIDDPATQRAALREISSYSWRLDTERLREWIQNRVYAGLQSKPWAADAKLSEMVGDKVGHVSLFGDDEAGEDPVSYATQMAAFIEIKMRDAKEKGEEMVRISTSWGDPDIKGVIGRGKYRTLETAKALKAAKTKIKGIVAEGDKPGTIVWITTDPEESESGDYRNSAKEKSARKAELARQKKRKAGYVVAFHKAIGKVKPKLAGKQVDALFEFAMYRCGYSYQQPVCALLGLEPVRKEEKIGWGDKEGQTRMKVDYGATIRKYAEDGGAAGKLRATFALLMPQPGEYHMDEFKKAVNRL